MNGACNEHRSGQHCAWLFDNNSRAFECLQTQGNCRGRPWMVGTSEVILKQSEIYKLTPSRLGFLYRTSEEERINQRRYRSYTSAERTYI